MFDILGGMALAPLNPPMFMLRMGVARS